MGILLKDNGHLAWHHEDGLEAVSRLGVHLLVVGGGIVVIHGVGAVCWGYVHLLLSRQHHLDV